MFSGLLPLAQWHTVDFDTKLTTKLAEISQFNMQVGNHVTGKKHLKNVQRMASLTLTAMATRDKLPCDTVVYAEHSNKV